MEWVNRGYEQEGDWGGGGLGEGEGEKEAMEAWTADFTPWT